MGNVHMIQCMISYVCTTISYVNLRYHVSTYDILGYQESAGAALKLTGLELLNSDRQFERGDFKSTWSPLCHFILFKCT